MTIYGCGQDEAALFLQMAPRLGVLPTIVEAAICEANVDLARGNRCVSVDHRNPVTNSIIRGLSEIGVRYISTRSVGFNHIDVEYAGSVGITVGNVAYSPDSVADFALMQMLMVLRRMKSIIRRTDIHDYRLDVVRGRELRDQTVGVIGTGRIGAAVLHRLRGFGCRILAHDSYPRHGVDYVPLDELLRQSDIVTLHTPLTPETHHLLNRQRIAQMKHGAIVINTGRGPLIETDALVTALEEGRIGGAALDVVEGEEEIFYADHSDKSVKSGKLLRLQEMANVIISPHTAYYTDHALSDTVENSLTNCLTFESGYRHG
ncbi:D-isomer specific 2-hydroxyacid dehydrogenase family protein [Actinoplanes subtropicus]|uniref:D-isomer specific 2-hydroxyacid dehydrogenase family protein n=1 Tax=Actinoplanes subtropicus TaxID=543632 RepID=UPI001FDFAD1F|nr:D-isomer specific 2-hydroxyacid dehydrogenase family protein [Actinoplanes subtropicus]